MDNDFVKKLDFDSDTFEEMKKDMNFVLQRLLGNMQEKDTTEGSMTLKIDVSMVKEFIPNYDPEVKGETREVSKPKFKHKVTSAVKINDEKSGNLDNEMELYYDTDTGTYELRYIANTSQRSIFDSDFQEKDNEDGTDDENIIEGTAIEGKVTPALPGPTDEGDIIDGDYREAETEGSANEKPGNEEVVESPGTEPADTENGEAEPGEGLDDITDELLGDEEKGDGYDYEEPQE